MSFRGLGVPSIYPSGMDSSFQVVSRMRAGTLFVNDMIVTNTSTRLTPTTISSLTSVVYSARELLGGLIVRNTVSSVIDQFPSASAILSESVLESNMSFSVLITNVATIGSPILTIVGNTDLTVVNSIDIYPNQSARIWFVVDETGTKIGVYLSDPTRLKHTVTPTPNSVAVWNGDVLEDSTVTITSGSMWVPGSVNLVNTGNKKISLGISDSVVSDYNFTLPLDIGAPGQYLKTDGVGAVYWDTGSGGGGGGDVLGPASATDNAIARFNGVSGKAIQNSLVMIDDLGNLTIPGQLYATGGTFSNKVAFNNFTSERYTLVNINTAGPETYTAANILNKFIQRNCSGASRIDTTDTAANIVQAIPNAVEGTSFYLYIQNTSLTDSTITLQGGLSVTISGSNTIKRNDGRLYLVYLASVLPTSELVTFYDQGNTNPSGVPGGSDTSVQYNSSNAISGDSNFTWNYLTQQMSIRGKYKMPTYSLSGAVTGKSGTSLEIQNLTFNNTSVLPTETYTNLVSISTPTFTSSNPVTTTNAATLYIEGSPIQGSNQTLTNSYSMWIDSGTVRIDDTITCGNINSAGTISGTSITDGTATLSGGSLSGLLSFSSSSIQATSLSDGVATLTGGMLSGLVSPLLDSEAANKGYVDAIAQGLSWKESVKVTTTTNIVLSGLQVVDGVLVQNGNRILVKDQILGIDNGIYIASSGVWNRSTDMQVGSNASGASVLVNEGSLYSSVGFLCNNTKGQDIVGTDPLVFIQFTGASSLSAGNGISILGNTISVDYDTNSIDVSANKIQVKNLGITSDKLGTNSVTTTKILDQAVTNTKIATPHVTVNAGDGLQNGGLVSLGGQTTLNVDQTVLRTQGDQSANGIFEFTNATQSTNSQTGAVVISGGLGLGLNLYTGGNIVSTGSLQSSSLTDGTATLTSGNLQNINTLEATTITCNSITDGTATLTLGNLQGVVNITGSGTIQAQSLSDGVATLNNGTLTGLTSPSNASDATNKDYVDNLATGLNWLSPSRVASTGNLVLSGEQTIDSIACVSGDRVLVKDQLTPSENGIYVVSTTSWSRSSDMSSGSAKNFASYISEGTLNSGASYVITGVSPYTIGTSALVWTQFSGNSTINAGVGLQKTGNTINLDYDNITLGIVSNTLEVKNLGINSNKLASNSVTTTKILDQAVTNPKLQYNSITINTQNGIQNGSSVPLGGSVTLEVDSSVLRTSGNFSASGTFGFTNTTQSTSTSTGTVVVQGGVGIAKNIYSGENVTATGSVQGSILTDGVATLTSGSLTNLVNTTMSGDMTCTNIIANGQVSLREVLGTEYITIRSPNNVVSNYDIVLPDNQGSPSSVLLNDGSGGLTWSTTIPTGLPVGAVGSLQYNNSGSWGASDMIWDSVEKTLLVGGSMSLASVVRTLAPSLVGSQLSLQSHNLIDSGGPLTTNAVFNSIAQPILSAVSPTTTTNAATMYIENSPLVGTNQTVVNNYALWVKNGNVKVGDSVVVDGTTTSTTFTDGIAVTTQGNITNVKTLKIADNKTVFVYSENDFPTAVGGFHTLADNTNYIVTTQITMTDGIQFGNNTSITGSGYASSLTFGSTLTGFKSVDQNVYLSSINIYGGGNNATGLCDFRNINYGSSPPFWGRTKRLFINGVNFWGPVRYGIIDGFGTININFCFMNGLQTTTETGFVVTNGLSLEFNSNKIVLWKGTTTSNTGAQLTLGNNNTYNPAGSAIGMNAITINGNIFHPRDLERGILVEENFTVQLGTISGNTFIRTGGLAALIDYPRQSTFNNYNPPCISTFNINSNNGVEESNPVSSSLFTSNIALTTINTQNVYELIDCPTDNINAISINSSVAIQMIVTIGTPFVVGEIITGSVSGTEAIVVDVVSTTEYYIIDTSGSFNVLDSITGNKGGAGAFSLPTDGLHFQFKYLGINPRKLQFSFSALLAQNTGNNKDWEVAMQVNGSPLPITGRCFVTQTSRPQTASLFLIQKTSYGDIYNFVIRNLTDNISCIITQANFTAQ